jgi:hypothetical protein
VTGLGKLIKEVVNNFSRCGKAFNMWNGVGAHLVRRWEEVIHISVVGKTMKLKTMLDWL